MPALVPPFLLIRGRSLVHNASELIKRLGNKGIELNCVTKAFLSDTGIVELLYNAGVRIFSDSRLSGCQLIKEWAQKNNKTDIKVCLLRPPAVDEIDKAIEIVDRFYVSTLEVTKMIAERAKSASTGKPKEIILMVETGDQREGFLEEELPGVFDRCSTWNIDIVGIGTNVACLRGQRPTVEIINRIVELNQKYLGSGATASPGNSSALYLFRKGLLPDFKGELRIGEALLLGNDTVTYKPLPFLKSDAFELNAEVIESRKKACDKIQTVVALGVMDIGRGKVVPVDLEAEELNRSSDHLVLCTREKFSPGDIIRFKPSYFALVQAFISPLVKKVIV